MMTFFQNCLYFFIYWLYILMNLTNQDLVQADQSFELRPYKSQTNPLHEDLSYANETQLLEPSAIQQNSSFCISSQESFRKPFMLRVDENNHQFYDLADEFEIVNDSIDYLSRKSRGKNGESNLQAICKELAIVTNKLQNRLSQFEREKSKSSNKRSQQSIISEEGPRTRKLESLSKLTRSTGTNESIQRVCNLDKDQMMQVLLELIQARGQIKMYKQQHERVQSQLIRLNTINVQQSNELRKKNTQIVKLKELLRQYQLYHKNRNLNEKNDQKHRVLDNSLDRKLSIDPDKDMSYFKNQAQYLNIRQTPKTPNNIGYHRYKKSLNLQKTKARQNSSAQHNFLKQLIGLSSSNEKHNNCPKGFLSSSKKYQRPTQAKEQSPCSFYQKYPFNQLLEMDVTLKNCMQLDEKNQDHISTMQSLPELSDSHECQRWPETSNYCFKKYIPLGNA